MQFYSCKERHAGETREGGPVQCVFGYNFKFPIHKKCLLQDHHKKCHSGLLHKDPIMCQSDTPRRRSRSPIGTAPTVQAGNLS